MCIIVAHPVCNDLISPTPIRGGKWRPLQILLPYTAGGLRIHGNQSARLHFHPHMRALGVDIVRRHLRDRSGPVAPPSPRSTKPMLFRYHLRDRSGPPPPPIPSPETDAISITCLWPERRSRRLAWGVGEGKRLYNTISAPFCVTVQRGWPERTYWRTS